MCVCAGCAAGPAPKPSAHEVTVPAEPAYIEHTITWPGETLSIIAKWYTGSINNWQVLAQENPAIDPGRMQIGSKIRIPANLLSNRQPMPKEFLDKYVVPEAPAPEETEHKPAASEPSLVSPPQEEEPKLFGPKDGFREKSEPEEPQLFGPKTYPQK